MFGIKTGMPHLQKPMVAPRPALGMPGLKRGSLPGLTARATMPSLTGSPTGPAPGYQDALRQQLLGGLMKK